jgi:hypothetical protein
LAQQVRFSQLVKIIQGGQGFSITIWGVVLVTYIHLLKQGFTGVEYREGYDLLEEMVLSSKKTWIDEQIESLSNMLISDYMSGVFNVKYNAVDIEWRKHILDSLKIINEKSKLSFSFNLLSLYSDM